jgi:ubiquinone/menaquinone biosynthesis C-methylase UbiE
MFRRRTGRPAPPPPTPDWRSFDEVAEVYGRVRAPIHAPPARDLVASLGPPGPAGLLDVGIGTGVAAAAASEAGWARVVGVDRSIPMLEQARARGIRNLLAASAIDLPFRDAAFDAVSAAFVLHTFPKYDTALFDMIRVLRQGGRLGAATWSGREDEFSRTWRAAAEAYATKDLVQDAARQAAPWQERFSDPTRLEEALRNAGLRPVTVERREYRMIQRLEDYLLAKEASAVGRFLRQMLGGPLWERFRARTREEFAARFPDPLGDTSEVLLAVGTRA